MDSTLYHARLDRVGILPHLGVLPHPTLTKCAYFRASEAMAINNNFIIFTFHNHNSATHAIFYCYPKDPKEATCSRPNNLKCDMGMKNSTIIKSKISPKKSPCVECRTPHKSHINAIYNIFFFRNDK